MLFNDITLSLSTNVKLCVVIAGGLDDNEDDICDAFMQWGE